MRLNFFVGTTQQGHVKGFMYDVNGTWGKIPGTIFWFFFKTVDENPHVMSS